MVDGGSAASGAIAIVVYEEHPIGTIESRLSQDHTVTETQMTTPEDALRPVRSRSVFIA